MGRKLSIEKIRKFVSEESTACLISTEYFGWADKLIFRCACGNTFETSWNKFKSGQRRCNDCAKKGQYEKKRLSMEDIRQRILDRDAEYVSGEYRNRRSMIRVRCSCGTEFDRSIDSLLRSEKIYCPDCGSKNRIDKQKLSLDEIKTRMEEKGVNLLSESYKDAHSELLVQCSCGSVYSTTWNRFTMQHQYKCRKCSHKESYGERNIRDWLESNGVVYTAQKSFPECGEKRAYPFDFYLPEHNLCIEFDGEQHFKERSPYFSPSISARDNKKTKFCVDNGIGLLRISYLAIDSIPDILAMSIPR